MTNLAIPALITVAALALYQGTAMAVGKARYQHKVMPPATSGPPEFERVLRVQQNTLPAFWLASLLGQPSAAAVLGIVWVAGRLAYAVGYIQAPEKRGPGFGISFISGVALLVMAVVGAISQLGHG